MVGVCQCRKARTDSAKVVVEKAFTLSSAEADRIIAAQKQSGTVLTVFQSKSSVRDATLG